jgi:hypothetical protein
MSRLPTLLAITLVATSAAVVSPAARAADMEEPYSGRSGERFREELGPPPPAWNRGPGPHAFRRDFDGPCRVFLRRRPGPFGEEVRRVRVCDEGPFEGHPRWARDGLPPHAWHDRPPMVPDMAPEE